jgi:alkylation response protein AidB-like acyl-CoA dehydrogenase
LDFRDFELSDELVGRQAVVWRWAQDKIKLGARDIGGGFRLDEQSLNAMTSIVAARGIGLAKGALMCATQYVKNRPASDQMTADTQGIQWEIAKCATETFYRAARQLTVVEGVSQVRLGPIGRAMLAHGSGWD